MRHGACPLDPVWRTWSTGQHFRIPEAVRQRLEAGRRVAVGGRLAVLDVAWRLADDDARVAGTPPPPPSFRPGSPQHRHADVVAGGVGLHVDELSATADAPGRSYLEYRVFAGGELVGRGGTFGCSLGVGGSDLPVRVAVGEVVLVIGEGGVLEVRERRDGAD